MNRKEAIDIVRKNWPYGRYQLSEALETLIPEFKENAKSIRNATKEAIEHYWSDDTQARTNILSWLEKQGEQKPLEPIHFDFSGEIFVPTDPFRFNLEVCFYNFAKSIAAECLDTDILDEDLDKYVTDEKVRDFLSHHINRLIKYHPLQKPEEWDDEDKLIYQHCLRILYDYGYVDWFKFHCQPHQDWNNCNIQHDQCKSEQKSIEMIQWKGDNLKEVIGFTGKSDRFDEWFKNWEEFEEYVHKHGNILKLFDRDGSHYEVPVGAWIVKTPDGYNVPSVFTFKQKHVEWSEEDENAIAVIQDIIRHSDKIDANVYTNEVKEKLFDWNKSLKPNHWKPTKLDLQAVYAAICVLEERRLPVSANILKELYDNLKKL